MIFDLAQNFHDAVAHMPKHHSRHRILQLLQEAIRRDIHFIDRHPTTLFQCMWNTCWWYDCPHAAGHYEEPKESWSRTVSPWTTNAPKTCHVLERWFHEKGALMPGFRWLRSMRPPHLGPLGQGLVASMEGANARFSPDGKLVATTGAGHSIHVWCVEDMTRLAKITPAFDPPTTSWRIPLCLLDVRIGRVLCTGSESRVRLWRLESSTPMWDCLIDEQKGKICCLCASPDGEIVAVGTSSGEVLLIDLAAGRQRASRHGHNAPIASLCFSADGRRLASSSGEFPATRTLDTDVCIWRVETLSEERRFPNLSTRALQFSADGRRLYTGSKTAATVHVWDVASGQERRIVLQGGAPHILAISPDERWVAVGGEADRYREAPPLGIWDLSDGRQQWTLDVSLGAIFNGGFSGDSTLFTDGSRIWRLADAANVLPRLRGHRHDINDMALSRDGRYAATASSDTRLCIWDLSSGLLVQTLGGHYASVDGVAFSHDCKRLVGWSSEYEDQAVLIWDVESGTLLEVIESGMFVGKEATEWLDSYNASHPPGSLGNVHSGTDSPQVVLSYEDLVVREDPAAVPACYLPESFNPRTARWIGRELIAYHAQHLFVIRFEGKASP